MATISPIFIAAVVGLTLYLFVFSDAMSSVKGKKGCGCPNMKARKEKFQLRDLLGSSAQTKEHAENKFDDTMTYSKASHYMVQEGQNKKEANKSGLVTLHNTVNTPLQMDGGADFQVQYAQIVAGEIGQSAIDSQKEYNKYVATDNSIRYIDTQIETDYIPFTGLSLSRMQAPKVVSSNSTQIQGIDVADYTSGSQGSLRSFVTKSS